MELLTNSAQQHGDIQNLGFSVHLENFDGPFDLLLQLISRHKLDVTEVALSIVTDEFIGYIRALEQSGEGWQLDKATEFLVIAATLLDLKAAKLLPQGEVEDEADLALLEARDLLFARLLQYRAFKEIAATFAERIALSDKSFPRTTALDPYFATLLPEVLIGVGPERFAVIADRLLIPRTPPIVSVDHIHRPIINVAEQTKFVAAALRSAKSLSFRALIHDVDESMMVVARFLSLLDLYRSGLLRFDQLEAFTDLQISWIGPVDGEVTISEEFDLPADFIEDTPSE
jgi:segregation and condensation protein A